MIRQMLRDKAEPPDKVYLTPVRALRLATERAAERSVGMSAVVADVEQSGMTIDELAGALADDTLLVQCVRGGEAVGFVGLDLQMRAAVVETRTSGQVMPKEAPSREVTRADHALNAVFVQQLLAELLDYCDSTELADWIDGAATGRPLASPRTLAMEFDDIRYSVVRLTLSLVSGRDGIIWIAMPEPQVAVVDEVNGEWQQMLEAQVMASAASINVVLSRISVPITQIARLSVGDVLPLSGAGVEAVSLEGPGGAQIGQARLGQLAGQRAIRLEAISPREMTDMPYTLQRLQRP